MTGATAKTDSTCTACDAGTFQPDQMCADAAACGVCPAGKYAEQHGQTMCKQCPAGKFESAAGLLIAALHNAGLVTLTSTPLGAETKIRDLLGRPANEKVFLLMPVGQPAPGATVPYREGAEARNPLDTITSVH